MRLVIAQCSVDYVGRLTAHLPSATRLLLVKADGSVSVHADGGAYKPLNWIGTPAARSGHNGTSVRVVRSRVTGTRSRATRGGDG